VLHFAILDDIMWPLDVTFSSKFTGITFILHNVGAVAAGYAKCSTENTISRGTAETAASTTQVRSVSFKLVIEH